MPSPAAHASFKRRRSTIIPLLLTLTASTATVAAEPAACTYSTYRWNTFERRAVQFETVQHPYSELQADEIHPETGCTVCREDQEEVSLPGVPPFRICRHMAPDVGRVLGDLIARGEPITEVVGYRVGRTRGEPDAQGNRTGFSNHSFGIAIDVNPEQNGLYDQCETFGPQCRQKDFMHFSPSGY